MCSFASLRAIDRILIWKLSACSLWGFTAESNWLTVAPENCRLCYEDSFCILWSTFKMASVGGRAATNLSLGQRLFSAFREWYIYAAGYRQIGEIIF